MITPYFLANEPRESATSLPVHDKFTGEEIARVAVADAGAISDAISRAAEAAAPMAGLPAYARQAVLEHCLRRFEGRREELALLVCAEGGKPIRDARAEVTRLIDTFKYAAGEAVRIGGEVLDLEVSPRARGYRGMWKRVPIGPCSFISPFNFPLNLVAHKVAPAIAAGCPFVLKPASRTPLSALAIGEALAETDLPKGAFSILPCSRDGAELFTTDERLKLLSFTGSQGVGWDLKARAGRKKVVLELGGNAACIVDQDADVDDAVGRLVIGAFAQSGQSCISVQRILVHERIYDEVRDKLVAATRGLKCGDPRDEQAVVGPLIDVAEAERLEAWIGAAVAAGAKLLCGGERRGAVLSPAILEDVPRELPLCADEAFGPVAVLERFDNFRAALAAANASRFGLQAGVFTRNLDQAMLAWDTLEVGGVMINDVPSWRVDHMPYGGVKESGLGREGIRWAIEDMTEVRLLVIRDGNSRK